MNNYNETILKEIVHPAEKAVFKSMRTDMETGKALLNPEQLGQFLREATLNRTILKDAKPDILNSFEKEYEETKINGRVLESGYKEDKKTTNDELTPADTSFGVTKLVTTKLKAMCSIADDEKEDNIERETFEQTLLLMMGERIGEDLEKWALFSDTDITYATDKLLSTTDGWLKTSANKLISEGVATATGGTADFDPTANGVVSMFDAMIYAMPLRLRKRNTLKFYVPFEVEDAYRNYLANRGTVLGDQNIIGDSDLTYKNIPIVNCQSFDDDDIRTQFGKSYCMLTNPDMLRYGIWKNLAVEPQRIAKYERTDYYYRMRAGVAIAYRGLPSVTSEITLDELNDMPNANRI